jgi:aldose 1-epimerase
MENVRRSKLCVALAFAFAAAATPCSADDPRPRELSVSKRAFGTTPDGQTVDVYTLTNAHGLAARIMTHGATLIAVEAPDRQGNFANVTLHLDTFDDYAAGHPLFGSTVGRFANRIKGAKFDLDGKTHELTKNSGANHIHGGRVGFAKLNWQAEPARGDDWVGVRLTHTSPDGHEGYPGELRVEALYRLTNSNELSIEYSATTTKPTHVNIANHAYWNLGGAGSGDVLKHTMMLNADHYLPVDEQTIPTGDVAPVKGTAMDFTTPQPIGLRIGEVGRGYDHCYVLKKKKPGNSGGELSLAARVVDAATGRVMDVLTTQPGVQVYTANYLSDRVKSASGAYGPHHAVCLETQHYPDTPNQPVVPPTVLRPGQTYREVTVHRFSIME